MRGGGVALERGVLGFGVERGTGLVEDEEQRLIAHEAARQRQLLPFARGVVASKPDSWYYGRMQVFLETDR